jgi:hypothetical protein
MLTSTRFLIGVAVGAVGAWFFFGRTAPAGTGVGGARGATRQIGRNSGYSGLRGI